MKGGGSRFERGAGIDRQASSVAIRVEIIVDGVSQALLFADLLEQSRTHATAQNGVEHVRNVALLVRDGMGRNPHAQLHLLERFLVARDNPRRLLRRAKV